jgi:hypothetical protein
MIILVCGSRHYTNYTLIHQTISQFDAPTIINGGATGADHLSSIAARELGFTVRTYLADWNAHGKAAGPIRNTQMLDSEAIDLVLAFSDDYSKSPGTNNMIRQAKSRSIEVRMFGKQLESL